MKSRLSGSLFACCLMLHPWPALSQTNPFSFGVIGPAFKTTGDESVLRDAIAETDADNLAFVVANGIKSSAEPCTDRLYQRRKALLDEAKNGLILSLAASDWIDCKRANGRSVKIERLGRLRDLFFTGEFSLGASKIPLARQSITPKFRNYGENSRWQFGEVMFATINLPANNNHYLPEAGRNSEFEDRMIANRDWLQRIFTFAGRKKLAGIVLFCDGDPLSGPGFLQRFNLSGKRDGFTEMRRQITALAAGFSGKVLVIHGQPAPKTNVRSGIHWRDNLGDLETGSGWIKLTVDASVPTLFAAGANSP